MKPARTTVQAIPGDVPAHVTIAAQLAALKREVGLLAATTEQDLGPLACGPSIDPDVSRYSFGLWLIDLGLDAAIAAVEAFAEARTS